MNQPAHLMNNYPTQTVTFVEGAGTVLRDDTGKEYLDFLSGLAVTSLGHAHPAVGDALASQSKKLLHVSNLFGTVPGPEVARRLDELLGGGGKVLFTNSGAEANEVAIKLARKYCGHGQYAVVSALRSFHGRTLATLHATGQPEKHEPFQPLPEGFKHVPYGDVREVERALDPSIAAVLVEPIQGEGGVNVPPAGYLRDLRELCDERNILLMLDEVQTGLGRTGRWFDHQYEDIRPDIVTIAKALGNGVPIGACWARAEVADAFVPGDHGTTYGGQPLATAAALAVLETMAEIDAPALSTAAGERLSAALSALPEVVDVRGRGLLLAAEIDIGERPAADVALACLDEGLVVNAVTPTAIRFAPPLTVSEPEIEEAVARFTAALRANEEEQQ